MQDTPKGERLHIAIFGKRNAGKSSLINALTKQDVALVSDLPGTTTDPVYKAMEILPLGPVVLIDTAGLDDEGQLGLLRVEKSKAVLNKTDLAILVIDGQSELTEFDVKIFQEIKAKNIPIVVVVNKIDLQKRIMPHSIVEQLGNDVVEVSTVTGAGIELLKGLLIKNTPEKWGEETLVGDIVKADDNVVLVVPIDSAAPKGRLILPQVQVLRAILDNDANAIIAKENKLKEALANLKRPPSLVITDSQVFGEIESIVPEAIPFTSFSILFARYKGDLTTYINGVKTLEKLAKNDKILIAEGCTHHRQKDDIGTVKIPKWLKEYTGVDLTFDWVSGGQYPANLAEYKLIIHCGACMLNRREVLYRNSIAKEQNVPIVNYGILIAYLKGILPRVIKPFQ
ncbi:MAG: [FeFe] hydrogenase H-cluster maturation GTPase HydF [Negativicutes bacterium]|nr:[FeFe] hydrogenase H-cluster maturation GTPase HydF [Negativicutes bacterium]